MFDTHTHLADPQFKEDRIKVIKRALEVKVNKFICICSSLEEMEIFSQDLAHYGFIWMAAGIHPHDASKYDKREDIFRKAFKMDKFCALGEIGLDYHYMNSPKEVQKVVFENQLRIAQRNNLPVIIHTREAEEDTYQILKKREIRRGLIHCFSGEKRALTKYLNLGFYISLAGNVTFPQASKLREIASLIPLNRLLVETDSPYLAPQKVRGQRNEPAFLKYTLEEIARLRKISLKRLSEITEQNAKEFFRITEKII